MRVIIENPSNIFMGSTFFGESTWT